MKSEFLETGKIVNTHGIRGELKLQPWADSPDFLAGFDHLYIDGLPVKVLSARVHKGCVIAALEGIDDINGAMRMKNKIVSVRRSDIKLDDDKYFIADIIGLRAVDSATDEELGIVVDVLSLPAGNVYIIKGEREILVPAVSEFVIETDINAGYIKLRLIEGM